MEFVNKIIQGDVREKLKLLPDNSVRCIVTSPPYFGLRDYGAIGQIGLEETPEKYVSEIVSICDEAKRVLSEDGTLWLNIGDSYCASKTGSDNQQSSTLQGGKKNQTEAGKRPSKINFPGIKPKDLIGIPWMVAFALRAAGWYLRCDIIWNKRNCMPESVTDRPTKNHEYLFLLSKSPKYYYNHDAIKTRLADSTLSDSRMYKEDYENKRPDRDFVGNSSQGSGLIKRKADKQRGHGRRHAGFNERWDNMTKQAQQADGANKRSVWTVEDNYDIWEWLFNNAPSDVVAPLWEKYLSDEANKQSVWTLATRPFADAHFATFPPDLIIDCIKAGSEEGDIVLDFFFGAGTTGLVAQKLQRNFIGIELNPKYIAIAENRLQRELGMFFVKHEKRSHEAPDDERSVATDLK